MLQAFCTQGPINFTYALATTDRRFIAFSSLFLIINTLLNQTISCFLIQRTNLITLESQESDAQEFNEGNDQVQGVMKGFVDLWEGVK